MKNNSEKTLNTSTTITINYSSKKGKYKSGASSSNNKPKEPQRGVSVAQLEKIRLLFELNSGILPHHPFPYFTTLLNSLFEDILEEIRYELEDQAAAPTPSPPFCYPPLVIPPSYGYLYNPNNTMMGLKDYNMERPSNMGYLESQFQNTARWNPYNNVNVILENHAYAQQPTIVAQQRVSHVEGENNQKTKPTGNDELDLELRL